jgi:hypothetical protein
LKTFAQTLCEHVGCAPKDYLRVALKHCLYPWPHSLHRLFALFVPTADIKLLKDAGMVTTDEQLEDLLLEYRENLELRGGFAARHLKLRISSGRLEELFKQVMAEQNRATAE